MDAEAIKKVCRTIYQKFPDLKGVTPSVKPHSAGQASKGSAVYMLTFQEPGRTQDGRQIFRRVQVTANETGGILKIAVAKS